MTANGKSNREPEAAQRASEQGRRPVYPPHKDPAFSAKPASSGVKTDVPQPKRPPIDTVYAGHPEFCQDAAGNEPPQGMGNAAPPEDHSPEPSERTVATGGDELKTRDEFSPVYPREMTRKSD